MKKALLGILFLFITKASFTNNFYSIQVENLTKKAMNYFYMGNDSGFIYIDSAITLSNNASNSKLIANSHKFKGIGYYFKEKNNLALEQYNLAIKYYSQINDSAGIAQCFNNIAVIHHIMGDLQKSIDFHFKALGIREQFKDTAKIMQSYMGIANAIGELGNNQQAISYNKKALDNAIKLDNQRSIASIYNNMGTDFSILNQVDSAIHYYRKALKINQQLDDKRKIAQCYVNIANNIAKQKQHDQALVYYDKSIEIAQSINNRRIEVGALTGKARISIELKSYNAALLSLNSALAKIEQADFLYLKRDIYRNFAELYEQTGKYKNAVAYHKLYIQLKDSIANKENTQYISDLETKYQTEKKEQTIQALEQENLIKQLKIEEQNQRSRAQWFFILIVILVFGFAVYIYRQKSKQQVKESRLKIDSLKSEQKMLRLQMNPHFIFNALNAVQSFIIGGEHKHAERFLAQFAKLMRGVLESLRVEYVPLDEEIENIGRYIELEQIRFENRFTYNINFDEELETEFLAIPPMIIQPFVEHAILHGFRQEAGGRLEIDLKEKNNLIVCTITDNRKLKNDFVERSNSTAMDNAIDRLKNLAQTLICDAGHIKTEIKNENNTETKGTKVEIKIPFTEI